MRLRRYLMLVLMLLLVPAAFADVFRPAYLQLTQTAPDRYEVLWKVPALDETTTLKVRPEFPDGTVVLQPARSSYAGGTAVQRWRITVPGRARRKNDRIRRPVRNWN